MTQWSHRTAILVAFFMVGALGCSKQKNPSPPATKGTSPTATPEAKKTTESKTNTAVKADPFLYKIEGPNGPVYMLGTIHIAVDPKKELSQAVWKAFDASTMFVMETDTAQAQAKMATKMLQPPGQTLQKQLGEDAWKKLDKLLDGRAAQYNGMKSFVVVTLLLLKMIPKGVDATASMDGTFLSEARQKKKEIGFLEPPEFQIDVLEKTLTPDELKKMLNEFDTQTKDLAKMIEAYKKGDAASVEKMSFKDLAENPKQYEILFFKRNEAWIPFIEKYVKRGKVFVAFGAGHLFGERGVLKLLEKKGIKAIRIDAKGNPMGKK